MSAHPRNPDHAAMARRLSWATQQQQRAARITRQRTADRNRIVLEAIAAGMTYEDIRAETGLSVGRISQLRAAAEAPAA